MDLVEENPKAQSALKQINFFGGVFTMFVHDEGDISNEGTRLTGHGLRNMKMRAQRLGGTLEVSRNGGYQVCLTAPLLR